MICFVWAYNSAYGLINLNAIQFSIFLFHFVLKWAQNFWQEEVNKCIKSALPTLQYTLN
jgi:hypothetical protein